MQGLVNNSAPFEAPELFVLSRGDTDGYTVRSSFLFFSFLLFPSFRAPLIVGGKDIHTSMLPRSGVAPPIGDIESCTFGVAPRVGCMGSNGFCCRSKGMCTTTIGRKIVSTTCLCVVTLKSQVAMRKQQHMPGECLIPSCSATLWVLNIKTHLAQPGTLPSHCATEHQ